MSGFNMVQDSLNKKSSSNGFDWNNVVNAIGGLGKIALMGEYNMEYSEGNRTRVGESAVTQGSTNNNTTGYVRQPSIRGTNNSAVLIGGAVAGVAVLGLVIFLVAKK